MMTKNVDDFWKWVTERAEEIGIFSFRQLEKRAGLSHGSVNKRRNEEKFPTVEMAESLCRVLRVSWIELWSQAGFISTPVSLPEWEQDPSFRQLVEVISQLRPEERDEVLAYAQLRLQRQGRKGE